MIVVIMAMGLLILPAAGAASSRSVASPLGIAPVPSGAYATITGAGTADFAGFVNSGGIDTTFHFEYAPASNVICGGTDSSLPESTPESQLDGLQGTSDVTSYAADLTPGSSYCVVIVASNAIGSQVAFATSPRARGVGAVARLTGASGEDRVR